MTDRLTDEPHVVYGCKVDGHPQDYAHEHPYRSTSDRIAALAAEREKRERLEDALERLFHTVVGVTPENADAEYDAWQQARAALASLSDEPR